jgi:hypothetical protein
MSDTSPNTDACDLLNDLVPLSVLVNGGDLPYRSTKPAQRWLDRMGVPYVLVGYRRHYRLRNVRAAIERNQVMPPATA